MEHYDQIRSEAVTRRGSAKMWSAKITENTQEATVPEISSH